jgi:protein-disulfide isomerase
MEEKARSAPQLTMPMAVVAAGALIGGGLFLGLQDGSSLRVDPGTPPAAQQDTLNKMNPVTTADHIRGSASAQVIVVEYSDTECPFCKRFHTTLQQLMTEYNGKVAWVYRHYPLDQLHSKARKEAEATECAAELGGNDKFWAYLDRLMEVTPANNGLDPAELPNIAQFVGLDRAAFTACLSSGRHAQKIEAHVQNAIATGGGGTPWSIVVTKSGKKYPVNGALPYANLKQVIDQALQNK